MDIDGLVERLNSYRPTNEWGDGVHHVICTEASAEITRLRGEVERLRADLARFDADLACEGCGAPLYEGDDYVTDPDGVAGCWSAMTDVPSKRESPCFAYRVDLAKSEFRYRVERCGDSRHDSARSALGDG
jgi:hypothetical protein